MDLVSTPAETLSEGEMELHDPSEIDYLKVKLGMHSMSANCCLVYCETEHYH
jgi:hypothetical protein